MHTSPATLEKRRCPKCDAKVPEYDVLNIVAERGSRQMCTKCYNAENAASEGLPEFRHVDFEPARIVDCDGVTHTFHFRMRLFGPGIALDGFELRRGQIDGYQFVVIGDPRDDPRELMRTLIEKIHRGLAVKHLEYVQTLSR